MSPWFALRTQYRQAFVDMFSTAAVWGDPAVVRLCYKAVATAQRQLWKLKWDNAFKEV
jgi:hypothetical protein